MLIIKDLTATQELDGKAMAAVHGGHSGAVTQGNATYQNNTQKVNAPIYAGNGSAFMGKGDVSFDITSSPSLTASNESYSTNSNSKGWGFPVLF
jgi:hypothetical protein